MKNIYKKNGLLYFVVDKEALDIKSFLLSKGLSLRMFNDFYKNKKLWVNGKLINSQYRSKIGDAILLDIREELEESLDRHYILEVVYEDEFFMIVNKPNNIPIHESKMHRDNTLAHMVAAYFKAKEIKQKVRFVNRLDRDTRGLVIVAKDQYTDFILSKMIENGDIIRRYLALVEGHLEGAGTINKRIEKIEASMKRVISPLGQEAITHYRVINNNKDNTLVEVELESGRGHQIRIHLSSIGHPLVGDNLYDSKYKLRTSYVLLANYLEFIHPFSKEALLIELELDSLLYDEDFV